MIDVAATLRAALADRYVLERELGRGGMATVYLAQDLRHHRPVALKVLLPDLSVALGSERFLREIRIASGLTHPHILPLFDSGSADGLLYYVMPYVAGESLRSRLHREGALPVSTALHLARNVLAALGYAHSQGIVHRDIKPENILLAEGEALVGDFGLARSVSAAATDRLTVTGLGLGTPAYMSPEQAAGDPRVDGRSDLYSLGCVLYEMLAGEPPFTGPTAQAVVARRFSSPAPSIRTLRDGVPAEVDRAIATALARTPADRFPNAAEFARALEVAAPHEPAAARAVPRRRRTLALAAVGLGLAAALVGLLLRPRQPSGVTASGSIAVLPFSPSAPDTALARLGRDLAATVGANLDRVGDLRTVDPLTVLAQAGRGTGPYSRADAFALAQRLGAGRLVHGSVVRSGRNVRLDFGLYQSASDLPVAHAQISGSPEDLTALTDSVTWALLRQLWRRGQPPTPSPAAITTRSVEALRHFLEGERAIVDCRWGPAAESYARAIEADSSFWLAYWRYAYAKEWNFEAVDSSVIRAYRAHRSILPERDRLLIEADMANRLSLRVARSKALTERFPDYWMGWMHYADHLVHWAPTLGYSNAEAQAALERTVRVHPGLVPAWEHLSWMAIARRDTLLLRRSMAELTRLGADESFRVGLGVDQMLLFRYAEAALRDRRGSAALLDSVATMTERVTEPFWQQLLAALLLSYGFPPAQIELNRRLLRTVRDPERVRWHHRAIAMSWAARGAWDSALTAVTHYRNIVTGVAPRLDGYRLAATGHYLGAVDAAAVRRERLALGRGMPELAPAERQELAWWDGIVASVGRDEDGLRAARASLKRLGGRAGVFDRSLAAFEQELNGGAKSAGETLAALEWERAESAQRDDPFPYLTAINRFAASRLLMAAGDTLQAARLLTWHQGWAPEEQGPVMTMLAALGYLEQARIAEARAQTGPAREYYSAFLARYDLPVTAHAHLVREAQAALAELGDARAEPRVGSTAPAR